MSDREYHIYGKLDVNGDLIEIATYSVVDYRLDAGNFCGGLGVFRNNNNAPVILLAPGQWTSVVIDEETRDTFEIMIEKARNAGYIGDALNTNIVATVKDMRNQFGWSLKDAVDVYHAL